MRNSGKTFRRVLRALVKVSEGNNCIYVSNTQSHLNRAFDIAYGAVYPIYKNNNAVLIKQNSIAFPNGKNLLFWSKRKYKDGFSIRGIEDVIIYKDYI